MLDPNFVYKLVQKNAEYLGHNQKLIDIYEGNLLEHIAKDLEKQLSPQSYVQAMARVAPINVLPKIIDKLTNIYQTTVLRTVEDGTDADLELLEWYAKKFDVNKQLNCSNELFNLAKASLIYPYVHKGEPRLRVILNDRFVLYSDDPIEPYKPTHVIILAGKKDNNLDIFQVFSDSEIYFMTSDGKVDYESMALNNLDGSNPVGKLPFVYVNESKYQLMPKQDSDVLKLTKLIPIMLTDLNYAAMFQSFSVMYGINVDDEGIVMAPNVFWRFKSDPSSEQKPEVGMIKPEVDYDQVLKLIESELSMWLGTRGIRASTVGALTQDNFASGISKIIDEMDTFEARQKQTGYFTTAEEDLWDLVLNYMHPYWASTGQIENRTLWTPTALVKTTFAVQLPQQSRGQLVIDLKTEFESGFISRKRAIQKLNPEMVDTEVEELILEIDEERGANNVSETEENTQTQAQETEEVEDDGMAED